MENQWEKKKGTRDDDDGQRKKKALRNAPKLKRQRHGEETRDRVSAFHEQLPVWDLKVDLLGKVPEINKSNLKPFILTWNCFSGQKSVISKSLAVVYLIKTIWNHVENDFIKLNSTFKLKMWNASKENDPIWIRRLKESRTLKVVRKVEWEEKG